MHTDVSNPASAVGRGFTVTVYDAEAGQAPEVEFAVTEYVVVAEGFTVTAAVVEADKPSAASQL
jgi:hypothetical protein